MTDKQTRDPAQQTREQIFHACFEHASPNLTEEAVERQSDRITDAVMAILQCRTPAALASPIEAALRDAFPHFQDEAPVTPEAIKEIGRDWSNMVMNWAPVQREITFLDQDNAERKLEWEVFEEPAGAAWVIPDTADWGVVSTKELAQLRAQVENTKQSLTKIEGIAGRPISGTSLQEKANRFDRIREIARDAGRSITSTERGSDPPKL